MLPLELPKGLILKENFITSTQEEELLIEIDKRPWLTDLKRRVQHYGYKYDYKVRGNLQKLGEIPIFLTKIDVGFYFNQVIVNEYLQGQGIAPHIDLPNVFGKMIASLSLASECTMDFTKGDEQVSLLLPSKSLLILRDEARYNWKHGIRQVKSNVKSRRVSITFREVI